jgi:signal transduction histidine kinase
LTDIFIQIRRLDGDVVAQSPNLPGTLPLDPSMLPQTLAGPPGPSPAVVTVGGQQLLLYNTSFTLHGHVLILQVARPLQLIDQPLAIVRRVLLIGGGLVTLLAFGVGWLLAGAALRPINRITQTAQAIGEARDFGQRVAYRGPPDEVGRLATTFNAMLARLQEAYQAQRRFVADASHELRTPLTTIRGNLGLLQREPPISEADRVAVLADLVAESERMSRLVGDLLTLARADAGRPLRHEAVPVAPLLADIARRLAASHPRRPIHYEGSDGVAVVGDPDALMQVLLILLDNALKFTPPDGDIRVTTTATAGHVAIAVQDTGPGISPEALPHIFERFYQGDTARAGTGTGLGLAIARALVEALHGTISVESEAGRGSTFVVTLPRAPLVDAPAPSRTAAS